MKPFLHYCKHIAISLIMACGINNAHAQNTPEDEARFKEMIGYAFPESVSDALLNGYAYAMAVNSIPAIEYRADRELTTAEKKDVTAFYFEHSLKELNYEKHVDFIYRQEHAFYDKKELNEALKLARTPEGKKLINVMDRIAYFSVVAKINMIDYEFDTIDFDLNDKKFKQAFPKIKLVKN